METPRQPLLLAANVAVPEPSRDSRLLSPSSSCLSAQLAVVLAFGAFWCEGLVPASHGGQTPPFLPSQSAANLGLLSSQTKRGLLKCSVP